LGVRNLQLGSSAEEGARALVHLSHLLPVAAGSAIGKSALAQVPRPSRSGAHRAAGIAAGLASPALPYSNLLLALRHSLSTLLSGCQRHLGLLQSSRRARAALVAPYDPPTAHTCATTTVAVPSRDCRRYIVLLEDSDRVRRRLGRIEAHESEVREAPRHRREPSILPCQDPLATIAPTRLWSERRTWLFIVHAASSRVRARGSSPTTFLLHTPICGAVSGNACALRGRRLLSTVSRTLRPARGARCIAIVGAGFCCRRFFLTNAPPPSCVSSPSRSPSPAIPEWLPAVTTIFRLSCTTRMARRNAAGAPPSCFETLSRSGHRTDNNRHAPLERMSLLRSVCRRHAPRRLRDSSPARRLLHPSAARTGQTSPRSVAGTAPTTVSSHLAPAPSRPRRCVAHVYGYVYGEQCDRR